MTDWHPELVVDHPCLLGEGPIWHTTENKLYWVDITAGHLFYYDPVVDDFQEILRTDLIGGLTVQRDGGLLLFMTDGAVGHFSNGSLRTHVISIPGQKGFRFNDCIADPKGRVFSGTITYSRKDSTLPGKVSKKIRRMLGLQAAGKKRLGNLYRFDQSGKASIVIRSVGRPNGMGFSPDRTRAYVTDSLQGNILIHDFDPELGTLANPRVLVHVSQSMGRPDGLTVDREGGIWSALMDGSCVVRYQPNGREDRRVPLPTPRVTSLCFGGLDYQDLYITTAGGHRRDIYGPEAGALFRVRTDVPGIPEYESDLPV